MIYNKITVYTNIYNMYGGLVMSDYIISCCSTADLTEEHFNKRDNSKRKKATTHNEWWLSPYTYSYVKIYKYINCVCT